MGIKSDQIIGDETYEIWIEMINEKIARSPPKLDSGKNVKN